MRTKFVNIMMVLAMFAALFAVSSSGTALASGSTRVDNCSNKSSGGLNKVVCVGYIKGNKTTVTITNIRVLSNNQLNVLKNAEVNLFNNASLLSFDQRAPFIQVGTVTILQDFLNITVNLCQVKVVEIGKTNINIAECKY